MWDVVIEWTWTSKNCSVDKKKKKKITNTWLTCELWPDISVSTPYQMENPPVTVRQWVSVRIFDEFQFINKNEVEVEQVRLE